MLEVRSLDIISLVMNALLANSRLIYMPYYRSGYSPPWRRLRFEVVDILLSICQPPPPSKQGGEETAKARLSLLVIQVFWDNVWNQSVRRFQCAQAHSHLCTQIFWVWGNLSRPYALENRKQLPMSFPTVAIEHPTDLGSNQMLF